MRQYKLVRTHVNPQGALDLIETVSRHLEKIKWTV